MENPQYAKLSEIRQLQEYRKQLGAMLPYLDKKLKGQLQAELTTLEEQITNSGLKFVLAAATARDRVHESEMLW